MLEFETTSPVSAACGNNRIRLPAHQAPTSLAQEGSAAMSEIVEVLKSIDRRLAMIQQLMARPSLGDVANKSSYSCAQVAELTQSHGLKKYRPFTIRLACKDGRIPDAEKREDGSWAIPREAVLRILQEGIPPERRYALVGRPEEPALLDGLGTTRTAGVVKHGDG